MSIKYTSILIIVYYVLTMLFPSDNPLVESQRVYPQLCMGLLCVFLFYEAYKNKDNILEMRLFRAFMPLIIMGFIYIPYPNTDPYGQFVLKSNIIYFLKNFMGIPFMFYIYNELQKNEDECKKYIYVIFCVQVIYAIYSLWYDRMIFNEFGNEVFDSNAGFILVCCVPMALLIPNNRMRLFLYIFLSVACVYSGQRSAALAAALAIPLCGRVLMKGLTISDGIIMAIVFIVVGYPILNQAVENILLRNQIDAVRGQMGSGRGEFWMHVWNGFWEGDIFQKFLGHGTATVPFLLLKKYGLAIFSHNGWLDYLYMYGIIGLFLYARSIFSIYREEKNISVILPEYKNFLLIFFVIFFVKCSTSHGNWDISSMPMAMGLGVLVHEYSKANV